MAETIASAATGVMGSVIGKLAALLGEKYQLTRDVEHGIRFLKDELSTMDAVLQRLADKDDNQIDPLARDCRNKVRELSYDIEDCIDRFVLNHSHGGGGSKANFVRKAMRKVKMLLKDGGIAKEIQQLKSLVGEQSERGNATTTSISVSLSHHSRCSWILEHLHFFRKLEILLELMLLVRRSSSY